MIVGFLLFTSIMLSIVVIVLAIEMSSLEDRLSDQKANANYYRSKSDQYWDRLVETNKFNRKLIKSVDKLQDELIDALHEAESFRELANERSEEIEKQDERINILKRELENEFEWSMQYSESMDRLAGELEQTQETLNMLEHGYQLLKDENAELEDEIEALQQYIMESEYGDDL